MGGRAGPARLTFVVGNVAFEDIRYADGDAIDAAMKAKPHLFPNETVPTLELDDGTVISQSRDIAYYAARVGKMLPDSDPRKMADIDEAYTTIDELSESLVASMEAGHEGDKLKQVRAEWMEKKGKPMLRRLTEIFARGSKEGPFLHGAVPSVADFTLLSMMGFFTCGMVDHVPADFGVVNAPRLAAVAAAVKAYPAVAAYLEKHPDM